LYLLKLKILGSIMQSSMSRNVQIVLKGLLILTAILSLGSLFFRIYPLELLSHFRVYYFLLSCLIAIGFLGCQLRGLKNWLPLSLSLGLIVFNSAWILPWYLPNSHQGSGNTIRVVVFNINVENDQWAAIADALRTQQPDVAVLIETTPQATTELSTRLANLLPFSFRASGRDLTILSRLPLISPESKTFSSGTALITSLQVQDKTVKLIATHPKVPIKPSVLAIRNALLAQLATYIKSQKNESLIFLGDFNLTPWSPYYAQLVQQIQLHNTRLGFGIQPSWIESTTYLAVPDWLTALIKLPIDHIFVSQDIRVSNCKTLKAANSDHRMLWSDLVL
jgi:endonuclease/exonuclease/phosphatase (EEP) superfamily protein YafD